LRKEQEEVAGQDLLLPDMEMFMRAGGFKKEGGNHIITFLADLDKLLHSGKHCLF
jgi:hypothetical protein